MNFGRNHALAVFSAFVLAATAYAQSLGDIARQQRAQQQQQSQTQPAKVLTNDDLPHSGSSDDLSVVGKDSSRSNDFQRRGQNSQGGYKLPPEQWKTQISAMKQNIAAMQNQIDQTKASVRFVEAPIYRNGVQHNMREQEKLQQVDRMQAQLEEMKRQLEQAQEEARKQGYGSAVYDP